MNLQQGFQPMTPGLQCPEAFTQSGLPLVVPDEITAHLFALENDCGFENGAKVKHWLAGGNLSDGRACSHIHPEPSMGERYLGRHDRESLSPGPLDRERLETQMTGRLPGALGHR
jgi:hypothetical protein